VRRSDPQGLTYIKPPTICHRWNAVVVDSRCSTFKVDDVVADGAGSQDRITRYVRHLGWIPNGRALVVLSERETASFRGRDRDGPDGGRALLCGHGCLL
jgi:hypothetical protein